MLRIRAFQGLVPAPELVSQVACVPYDVVNTEEAAALAAGNPHSLMNVDRAEIHLPEGTDPYSDIVYQTSLAHFRRLQTEGVLRRENAPCVYLYQQTMGNHVQTGIACVCHIDDYENNIIKKHEKTRKDKEDDRTRLIDTLSADTGPVFLTYRDHAGINSLVEKILSLEKPSADFIAPDGIRHTVWKVEGGENFVEAFASVPVSYVADGHHRTASAVRVGRERRARNPHHSGNEDYNWFLCVLFPESHLRILPYNRLVKDLNGHLAADFLRAVGAVFRVTPDTGASPDHPGDIRMYLGGSWYKLLWQPAPDADPIGRLDVTGLQERLLAPLLGIDDPRTSKRIDFVGGIRGTGELVRRVDNGECAVAFSMYPTTLEQLMDIADADQIMPPKSTWFEPKLRSGLFVHTF
jgi:uncharacterized protein (DUF1015 family)